MAGNPLSEEKFPIPDSPLEVKLSIDRSQPPSLQVFVSGPRHSEHREPIHATVINHLFDELKGYIVISGLFPPQGKLLSDPYANDGVSLKIRYPSHPPARYPVSLMDMLILNPLDRSQRQKKNKKDSEKLFRILSEKMPVFIGALADTMQSERHAYEHNARTRQSQKRIVDQETQAAYDLLGVTPDTPWHKIKRAYHDLARIAHPDAKSGIDDGSFQKLQHAYELIRALHQKPNK